MARWNQCGDPARILCRIRSSSFARQLGSHLPHNGLIGMTTMMAHSAHLTLNPSPTSVGQARSFVMTVLLSWGVSVGAVNVFDIQVCASELASNALTHAAGPEFGFLISLSLRGDVILLEVYDGSCEQPQIACPTETCMSGRGLHIVEALSNAWGVDICREGDGKIVWAAFKQATNGAHSSDFYAERQLEPVGAVSAVDSMPMVMAGVQGFAGCN
ncbi:ATP-binding protein [Streptomyces roseus]|uniref:ATP-binding protein n=1 Tax=Streptomyces roseus TaxID=66430 RepID=UPI0038108639